jgi:hypothetical protein
MYENTPRVSGQMINNLPNNESNMEGKQMPQSQNDEITPNTLKCFGNMDEYYSYRCSTQCEGDFTRLCTKATLRKKIESWPFLTGLISSDLSENDK